MDSRELIRLFEIDALPGEFHHSDHVRLAFAYLCEYEIFKALAKFCAALKRFAAARGKTQLYNENHHMRLFFLNPGEDGSMRRNLMGRLRSKESRSADVERRYFEPILL